MSLPIIGRWIVAAGITLAAFGLLLIAADRLGLRLGRLPGDIFIQRGRATIAIPIATSLLLSVALTIILNILARWKR